MEIYKILLVPNDYFLDFRLPRFQEESRPVEAVWLLQFWPAQGKNKTPLLQNASNKHKH